MTRQQQQLEALRKADEVRLGAVRIRSRVRRHEMTLAEALAHPDASASKVGQLVQALPYVGRAKARRVVQSVGIVSFDRRVRDLTDRQRAALAAHPVGEWSRMERPRTALMSFEGTVWVHGRPRQLSKPPTEAVR